MDNVCQAEAYSSLSLESPLPNWSGNPCSCEDLLASAKLCPLPASAGGSGKLFALTMIISSTVVSL